MKEIGLLLIAIVLSAVFYILGIPYALFTVKSKRKYIRDMAESIDQTGNHVMGPLFNQWMLRTVPPRKTTLGEYTLILGEIKPYLFGNIDETVSSVLGKNQKLGTLTKSGRWLNRLLNKLDENHSIDAIEIEP